MDNAVVLQEVVYAMEHSRKKKGDLVLKLDPEKAYDRVDWRFLRSTLEQFGFPPIMVSLIMHGIPLSLFFGMVTGLPASILQGDCDKGILCPLIFLFCVWNTFAI